MKHIALVGNPNSGKTTLFNQLTGAKQKVGNWPGVTVEKKEGVLKGKSDYQVIDLPGIYSLSPYSLEEVIARDYIIENKPDLIINILDGLNLERNLYLTTQIIELGIPLIIVVNRIDLIEKNNDKVNLQYIQKLMNCQVIGISALKGKGIDELLNLIETTSSKDYQYRPILWFDKETEEVLSSIQRLIENHFESHLVRWYAIKLLEKDQDVLEKIDTPKPIIDKVIDMVDDFEKRRGDALDIYITSKRYDFVRKIATRSYQKNKIIKEKVSDRIDRFVTNKWLALPIFALIIFLVYYISIASIGGILTDYVNDTIFGEGGIPDVLGSWLEALHTPNWLYGLFIDGIIGGIGAVLGFLPQMIILFILLGILEESGYMARIAFILDRMFRKFGLSGKSFIPMLISTGCAIPGIMASRTIEDENNRKLTIMTTSFMPCGAKLPIIALIAGALFRDVSFGWMIAPSAYFVAIIAIIVSSIILRKFKAFAGESAPFIMELPDYQLPRVKTLWFVVYTKIKSFIKRAGTIILGAAVVVWLLSSFTFNLKMTDNIELSMLADIGRMIDIVFKPIGWGDWKAAVATLTGFIAKENVVSTFGILYGFSEVSENGSEVWSVIGQDFSMLSAYSFLIFNLICAPCFAAIGAIRREMGSRKWMWITIIFQTGFAYILALIIFQVGSVFTGSFSVGSLIGIITLMIMLYLLFRKNKFKVNE